MSGIKTARKKEIVDIVSNTIMNQIEMGRLTTRSDMRRAAKIIYKRLEEMRGVVE